MISLPVVATHTRRGCRQHHNKMTLVCEIYILIGLTYIYLSNFSKHVNIPSISINAICNRGKIENKKMFRCSLSLSTGQVSTLHNGCKKGIDQQILNRKSFSRRITHPQS